MGYQFIENVDKQEHDEFVMDHPLCNLLQSSKWGEVKENWDRVIVGVKDYDKLIASSMILIKQLPFKFTIFYIPRGPVMDYENISLVKFMLHNIRRFAKYKRCLFITFDPAIHRNDYLLNDIKAGHDKNIENILSTLSSCGAIFKGFTKSIDDTIQPRFHANVYASADFETSLSKSAKKGLSIANKKMIRVEPCGEEAVEQFSNVMHCTEERKHIHLRDAQYFQRLMKIYGEDAVLYLAKLPIKELYEETKLKLEKNKKDLEECPQNAKKKRFTLEELNTSLIREEKELYEHMQRDGEVTVISGALCVKFGKTAEILYAGMDDGYKRYMAPYASFYKCMTWSFEKGCIWCNMGGIEGDLKGGLTQFKENFNPVVNEFIGEFDLPVYSSLYKLAQTIMQLRKKALKKK